MNSAYKNIFKATTLFGSVQVFNILINLVRTKFVALFLGPAGVGLNAIYNEVRELVHSTTNLGLDTSGIRDISKRYEELCNNVNENGGDNLSSGLLEAICVLRSWVLLLACFGTLAMALLSLPLSYLTFQNNEHTLAYIILAPVVGLSTLACGEITILKGVRRLKTVAQVSVFTTIFTTSVSIPIYYYLHIDGVIPALIAIYVTNLVVAVAFTYKLYPPHFDFSTTQLRLGIPMLKVGLALMLTNLIDNVIQLLIQSGLNDFGALDIVGLYSVNNSFTTTYIGVFIASLSTDYFPRLSGLFSNISERKVAVLRQAEFLLFMLPPAILCMLVALPVLVPLLFSSEFIKVIPLTQIALVAVLFRILHLPFTYTPLAAGDSSVFFIMNTIQAVDMLLVIPGFYFFGLKGIGLMLLITNVMDWLAAIITSWHKYGITMSRKISLLFSCHFALTVCCYLLVSSTTGITYWISGIACITFSAITSYTFYRHA